MKSIIFDFDGVLAESVDIKTKAFAELYKNHGPKIVKQVVDYHLKNGGISRYEKFKFFQEVLLGLEYTEDVERESGDRFSNLVEEMVVKAPWVTGAKEFLDDYFRRINIYVVSATPDEELKRIIQKRNMAHYFRSVYGANRKKGESILFILEKNGYSSEEAMVVGDSIADYEGAMEAGAKFIGRVPEGGKSPFPQNVIFFNNPFDYLRSLNGF
ncbi:MAG TPA: HAD-IA family hydrolase [Nitrospinota bacterium]|nr:HAD-IA family hydrolase [Nitrospinota bacterium]|tara:strand:+ start:22002 stop:22640 length:639 start_codon:yes stop_codon:yes gene_type:complete